MSLLNLGVIRIGTLHDFRRIEHQNGIADPKEGTKAVSHHVEQLHILDSSNHEYKQSLDAQALEYFNAIKIGENCKNITIKNVQMSKNFNESNCFIFCTSKKLSQQTMKEFEGTNSCYEIFNPKLFYALLTKALNSFTPVIFKGVYEVKYQNREEKWNGTDWGHHPSLVKEPEFKNQHEIRAIWQPIFNQPIKPIILSNPEIIKACKKIVI